MNLGVTIAIIQNNRILLTQREDFEVWCLPGGGVDPAESISEAALREAREETGLEVKLTRLVGLYSMPGWNGEGHHSAFFAAEQVGEVIDIGYFDPGALPYPLMWWHRARIAHAFAGVAGAVCTQPFEWPFERRIPRSELYAMRDRSGLSRQEFFLHYFPDPER